MAKRPRAPARRGCATHTAQRSGKSAKKTAGKQTCKTAQKSTFAQTRQANLTRRQRELLEEFEAEAQGHSKGSPESEGFFSKVKEFFEGGRG